MADDIVERLRLLGEWLEGQQNPWDEPYVAADEIVRLRAELDRMARDEVRTVRLNHITTLGELQAAADEIERLRAAGDALATAFRVLGGLDHAYDKALRRWERVRQ